MKSLAFVLVSVAMLFCSSCAFMQRNFPDPVAQEMQGESKREFVEHLEPRISELIEEVDGYSRDVRGALQGGGDAFSAGLQAISLGIRGNAIYQRIEAIGSKIDQHGLNSDAWQEWMVIALDVMASQIAEVEGSGHQGTSDSAGLYDNPFAGVEWEEDVSIAAPASSETKGDASAISHAEPVMAQASADEASAQEPGAE